MTFAGVLVQSSTADPTRWIHALGLCFAFILSDNGKMTRHLQLLRDDAVFSQSPSRGTEISTLLQGNVARAQSRQRHVRVSVELQYSHVVSASDVACPLGVNVSCDRIKDLRQRGRPCFCPRVIRSYLVFFRLLAVVYSAVDDGRQADGGANVGVHAVSRRQDPVASEQRRPAHVAASTTFSQAACVGKSSRRRRLSSLSTVGHRILRQKRSNAYHYLSEDGCVRLGAQVRVVQGFTEVTVV